MRCAATWVAGGLSRSGSSGGNAFGGGLGGSGAGGPGSSYAGAVAFNGSCRASGGSGAPLRDDLGIRRLGGGCCNLLSCDLRGSDTGGCGRRNSGTVAFNGGSRAGGGSGAPLHGNLCSRCLCRNCGDSPGLGLGGNGAGGDGCRDAGAVHLHGGSGAGSRSSLAFLNGPGGRLRGA